MNHGLSASKRGKRAVEGWECRRGKLKIEFQEELSENVQVAILTSMVSRDLQTKRATSRLAISFISVIPVAMYIVHVKVEGP